MKIVVAEKISPSAIELLRQDPSWTIVTHDQIKGNLADYIVDADALIVRSAVQADAALLDKPNKIRVIGRAGIGVDNIDLEAATRKGIAVMNTPGANAVAVAEHTFAVALSLARYICRANQLMHQGKWEKKSLQGTELRGKVMGVIGLGRIGMEVAKRARAFEMKVAGHDPFVAPEVARDAGIILGSLDNVLSTADYVSLHLALTPQTARLINAETLLKMKKGSHLINCARGELVDETALAESLKSGHLAGAALDVFSHEPLKDSPLMGIDNVILTPHIAGSTNEAQDAVGYQIAAQVREYLSRGVIQNAVNVPSVSYEEYVEMQPYIQLAERLGAFLGQTSGGGLQEISIQYAGPIANWKTTLLRNAAVKGVLNVTLAEPANLVNSAAIAQTRGIRVRENANPKHSGGGAASIITMSLGFGGTEHVAKGSVLHGDSPRLLQVDGIDIEAPLERNLLYLRNEDVPGVIGRIGTLLGEQKINIANFSLGREGEAAFKARTGGSDKAASASPCQALAVVHVDAIVPENVLQQLRKLPAVLEARAVHL
ncbi:MAG TPA: phosphoglycerate dehydrogenase [Terriglobales bacterium]|nr:phosphoglycerate dehydrogenase [Terriglobales bacterium]